MQNPSVGRIVRYVLPPQSRRAGEVRPAVIVRPLCAIYDPVNPGMSNLRVLTDGPNDAGDPDWVGSVPYSDEPMPGTWHWPERG